MSQVNMAAFIAEVNVVLPEWRHPSPMAGVDKVKRTIKDVKGRVRNMPPDDGFDTSFFMFLENTNQDLEGVIHRTRVNPYLFFLQVVKAGYSPNFAIKGLFNKNRPKDEFMSRIDSHYKHTI